MSPEGAGGFRGLDELLRQRATGVGARSEQVLATLRRLKQTVAQVAARQDAADAGGVVAPQGIEVELVRRKVGFRDFEALSPKEARYVVLAFPEFPPHGLAGLLAVPRFGFLWRTFARRMLGRWDLSLEGMVNWGEYARIMDRAPRDLEIVGGPVPLGVLVSSDGPRRAFEAARTASLLVCFHRLTAEWGYRPVWGVTVMTLVTLIRVVVAERGPDEQQQTGASLRELIESPAALEVRRLLLPPVMEIQGSSAGTATGAVGRDVMTCHVVAALLSARFSSAPLMDDTAFGKLEPHLLRGSFGDPRLLNVSSAWERVRRLVPAPYADYLQSLIREDLAFFFRHAMQAQDRERFWLRYLGSIRRTICVLDPPSCERLRAATVDASPEIRASVARVVQTRASGTPRANAFCLFFDGVVVVEFSVTGHACFMYDTAYFESRFMKSLAKAELLSPTTLKVARGARHHLVHNSRWELRAASILDGYGIHQRDDRAPGTALTERPVSTGLMSIRKDAPERASPPGEKFVIRELRRLEPSLDPPSCGGCGAPALLEARSEGIFVTCSKPGCPRLQLPLSMLQRLAMAVRVTCFRCGSRGLESRERQWGNRLGRYLACLSCFSQNYWDDVAERVRGV